MAKIRPKRPSDKTLAKYGLSRERWETFPPVCALCQELPPSGRLFIDHEHVRKWSKKPSEERAKFVRGLLCYYCNRFLVVKNSLDTARTVVAYLEAFKERSSRTLKEKYMTIDKSKLTPQLVAVNEINAALKQGTIIKVGGIEIRYVGKFGALTSVGSFVPCDVMALQGALRRKTFKQANVSSRSVSGSVSGIVPEDKWIG